MVKRAHVEDSENTLDFRKFKRRWNQRWMRDGSFTLSKSPALACASSGSWPTSGEGSSETVPQCAEVKCSTSPDAEMPTFECAGLEFVELDALSAASTADPDMTPHPVHSPQSSPAAITEPAAPLQSHSSQSSPTLVSAAAGGSGGSEASPGCRRARRMWRQCVRCSELFNMNTKGGEAGLVEETDRLSNLHGGRNVALGLCDDCASPADG